MADKPTIEAYDKIAEEYYGRNSASFYEEQYELFYSALKTGNKIVEVGCGIGRDARELIKLGLNYLGIDASQGMLKVAGENTPEGVFRIGDFYALDLPDNSFDGFWAAATLLHVPKKEIDIVLGELKRILKPRGVGFISLKRTANINEGYIDEAKAGGIQRYFSFYTKDEFEPILERSGFRVINFLEKLENNGTIWLCFLIESVE